MTRNNFLIGSSRIASAATLAVALATLPAAPATAADEAADRLDRKVRVMERVIDEVLVQSPNVYVTQGTTRGLMLDEFGALFTVEASLGEGLIGAHWVSVEGGYLKGRIAQGETTGVKVDEIASFGADSEAREKRVQEHLEGFKVELRDALIDYGVTLAELDDEHWVAVAAFLDGSMRLISSGPGRRLVVKVKMRDLRQHSAGSLSREAVIGRVKIEER